MFLEDALEIACSRLADAANATAVSYVWQDKHRRAKERLHKLHTEIRAIQKGLN